MISHCKKCGKEIIKLNKRLYCGSKKTKSGCSYLALKDKYKRYRENHQELIKKYCRTYKRDNSVSYKNNIKYKYNLNFETYQNLLSKQNKLCAICEESKKLVVDHSHTTKKVRGLLCISCNNALGLVKDNPKILEKMIIYLN